MKKIIVFTVLLILIPFVVAIYYNNNIKEIELKYINNVNIRVLRSKSNTIDIMPLDVYLVGVLAGEMPISFEMEALKAQAVASRSYAMKRIEYNKNNDYDVIDTIMNQVYLDNDYLKEAWGNNYVKNINKLRKAVNETLDEYIIYDGEVIDAMFFSTSNGYTENVEDVFNFSLPYLKMVDSPWDKDISSAYLTFKNIPLLDFYKNLGLEYNKNLNIEIIKRSSSHRILLLKINDKQFKGTEVQSKLGLKSNDFEIVLHGDFVRIDMYGYGHGVGMSQYGALGMAQNGYNYKEILEYYYTNTKVEKIIF